jgi:transcriptional regulator with XRE-family HTH domain
MAKRARRKSEVTEEDVRRGARIRNRREELGLSQPGLAKLLDISQSTIWNIEAGNTLKSRHYHDILRALGLPPEPSPILALPPPPKPPAAATMTPNFLIPAPSAATELVRVFEITFHASGLPQMSNLAIASIPSPSELTHIADRYAFYVFNEEMWPRYRPGELLVIHPRIPARTDDGVVLRNANDEVMVREFVRSTPTEWIVRRYGDGGSAEETWPRSDWPMCHVVWEVRRG